MNVLIFWNTTMARQRNASEAFYNENFLNAANLEKNVRVYKRLLGLHHFQQGKSYSEVGKLIGVHWRSVQDWMNRYTESGMLGLQNQPGSGRKRLLGNDDESKFKQLFTDAQAQKACGRLIGKSAQALVEEHFGCSCSLRSAFRLLHRVGLSWVTGRDIHPNSDVRKQDEFKKTLKYRSKIASLRKSA
jgi:transposase